MLDLQKLMGQMQGMSEQLQREAQQLTTKLDRAENIFHQARTNQQSLLQSLQQGGDRFVFNCAQPVEDLEQITAIAPITTPHIVLATDGSQIAPSRHEIAYCYLINIGRVAIYYNSGIYPLLDNVPEVFYKTEDLYKARQWGIQTEQWMTLKRTVAENVALASLAIATLASYPAAPMLAFSDGALVHWELDEIPTEARSQLLPDILSAWDALKAQQIPLAGYISAPRAAEATNFLRLQLCPFEQPECQRHCAAKPLDASPCSQLQPLRDATLWSRFLKVGESSPLWQSRARIMEEYGEHQIYFCYLHVGTEVARVEMPAWTALNPNLRSQALQIILAQVQKGYGYPVALAEAHNQAVVTGSDRRRFFAILEQQMVKSGLRNIATSYKESRKRSSIA
ncbi:DNA double-strand break repair nuclease NurA [Pseudanabaena sp. FACHB-1998]|uniref:DNA double-strand break repair nuclease NurA n=1 Tax=Pseudanabaena sp. FACHB-1998 TaxID=2692858 RepID=UPI0016800F6B|nr:DNA double-strand break repair nuclease NurA [Pseudanabaena sp. FACHB-1998]MBD2176867.1 DNA double-strand break repair nuclease NurA [Pseudanabaena sp. FACHB-1998]